VARLLLCNETRNGGSDHEAIQFLGVLTRGSYCSPWQIDSKIPFLAAGAKTWQFDQNSASARDQNEMIIVIDLDLAWPVMGTGLDDMLCDNLFCGS
jgi:hypothetical protein